MSYAVACKSCGNVESTAWVPDKDGIYVKGTDPLTPRGHVPTYCPKCGARSWRVPATAEDIAKFDATTRRVERATELCKKLDLDGLFKMPEDLRASSEVKNALSNLFAPLEGETLERAQQNALKVARSGIAAEADVWVELYDKAVQKAIQSTAKGAKAA